MSPKIVSRNAFPLLDDTQKVLRDLWDRRWPYSRLMGVLEFRPVSEKKKKKKKRIMRELT